jgi:hypothetical protein
MRPCPKCGAPLVNRAPVCDRCGLAAAAPSANVMRHDPPTTVTKVKRLLAGLSAVEYVQYGLVPVALAAVAGSAIAGITGAVIGGAAMILALVAVVVLVSL